MAHIWLPDATSGTGTGNWTATGATGHWADDAEGTNLGKAAPGAGDSVLFGAAAFNGAGQIVTVNATVNCLDMIWTGATNTPTLAMSGNTLRVYGNIVFIRAMNTSTAGGALSLWANANQSITSNGVVINFIISTYVWGVTKSLIDAFNSTNTLFIGYDVSGLPTFATNNNTVTCGRFYAAYGGNVVLTLGSSVINCTSWEVSNAVTVTANTATINVSGTGAGTFGTVDYNGCSFNFIGTAHTLSGSPTGIKTMRWGRAGGVQTITGTAAMVLNVPRLLAVNGRNVLTIASTGAAWTITGNSGYFEGNYMSISNVTAGYANTYYAGTNSTNGGGNTNWIFRGPVRAVRRHGRW